MREKGEKGEIYSPSDALKGGKEEKKEREEIKRLIYGLSRRPLRSRQLKPESRN